CFFFQAEDGIRDRNVTGVQTCALPILPNNGSLVILFQQVMAFAIPEILMIFPLLSRGRDSDNKTLYSYLPISVSSYVLEKLLIYISLFPILACLFYNLFLWISGLYRKSVV